VALLLCELRSFRFQQEYFKFVLTYWGRGLLYVFFGCLTYQAEPTLFNTIVSIAVTTIGIIYFILAFVHLDAPEHGLLANFRTWTNRGTAALLGSQAPQTGVFPEKLQKMPSGIGPLPVQHPHIYGSKHPVSASSPLGSSIHDSTLRSQAASQLSSLETHPSPLIFTLASSIVGADPEHLEELELRRKHTQMKMQQPI